MASTTRTTKHRAGQEPSTTLRWRSWPLGDRPRSSWLALCGILAAGGVVWYVGGGWLLAVAAIGGLASTCWQFLLPVSYEINPHGLRRTALGRSRLVPWHAVHAYRLRPTGIILYRHGDPTTIDLLRSLFVPYSPDEDEMLCAMRENLPHAAELRP